MQKVKFVKDAPGSNGAVRWAKDEVEFMSPASAKKWVDAGFAELVVDEPPAEAEVV